MLEILILDALCGKALKEKISVRFTLGVSSITKIYNISSNKQIHTNMNVRHGFEIDLTHKVTLMFLGGGMILCLVPTPLCFRKSNAANQMIQALQLQKQLMVAFMLLCMC